MSEHEDNYYLSRRAAYWRNSVFELEQAIKHFSAHMAEVWVNDEDKTISKDCEYYLNNALILALDRQRNVIEAQIEGLYNEYQNENVEEQHDDA